MGGVLRKSTPRKPLKLVEATQTTLVLSWKKSTDATVDRYELQYRREDSPNSMWASLAVASSVKNVTLDNMSCHTAFTFRMRCHNPAGWSEFSCASDAFWSLPGAPEPLHPPVAGAVTNSYESIFWSRVNDHGAAPVVYFLDMRESCVPRLSSKAATSLREYLLEMRELFLKFMTGTNKIPLDGFDPPLNLTKSDLDPQALPRTHTCFNQLVLPEYTSCSTLVEKVTFAIQNAEGFDLS